MTIEDGKAARLTRPVYLIPDFVREALVKHQLVDAYRARPPYQQNDYIGWIIHAKREKTQLRRLQQMINELKDGTRYMKMKWRK